MPACLRRRKGAGKWWHGWFQPSDRCPAPIRGSAATGHGLLTFPPHDLRPEKIWGGWHGHPAMNAPAMEVGGRRRPPARGATAATRVPGVSGGTF